MWERSAAVRWRVAGERGDTDGAGARAKLESRRGGEGRCDFGCEGNLAARDWRGLVDDAAGRSCARRETVTARRRIRRRTAEVGSRYRDLLGVVWGRRVLLEGSSWLLSP